MNWIVAVAVLAVVVLAETSSKSPPSTEGGACDSAAFLRAAVEAERLRVMRRVTAEDFARMAKEPDTIVLDARGQADYETLRIKGSVNLPYTAMAAESLQRVIPKRSTRILIYCRNNLVDSRPSFPVGPVEPTTAGSVAYPDEFTPPQLPKAFAAGLNIPTYITLYIYGYRNVWELDAVVDPNTSVIEFENGSPALR
jgi:hypothetical protein